MAIINWGVIDKTLDEHAGDVYNGFVEDFMSGSKVQIGNGKMISRDYLERVVPRGFQFILTDIAKGAGVPDSVLNSIAKGIRIGKLKNKGNKFTVDITFDEKEIHRESLYDDEYPDGLLNIIALFNSGYSAGNYVYGWWDNHEQLGIAASESAYRSGIGMKDAFVRSRKEREGLWFVSDAIDAFNDTYKSYGIKAIDKTGLYTKR